MTGHFDEAIADFTDASAALSAAFELARNVRLGDTEQAANVSRALAQAATTARNAAQKVDARYSGTGNAFAVLTANAYDDTANAAFAAATAFTVAAHTAIPVSIKANLTRFHAARCYTDAASMLHTAARTYAANAFSSEVAE